MIRFARRLIARHRTAARNSAIIADAQRRLAIMAATNRASFKVQDFTKRREAALRGRAAHAR